MTDETTVRYRLMGLLISAMSGALVGFVAGLLVGRMAP